MSNDFRGACFTSQRFSCLTGAELLSFSSAATAVVILRDNSFPQNAEF